MYETICIISCSIKEGTRCSNYTHLVEIPLIASGEKMPLREGNINNNELAANDHLTSLNGKGLISILTTWSIEPQRSTL